MPALKRLQLTLTVNGEVRQDDTTANLVLRSGRDADRAVAACRISRRAT